MYSIHPRTSAITFPDGYVLNPPYDDPRYLEYATWINSGNTPGETPHDPYIAVVDVSVNPDQARTALHALGLYTEVQSLMYEASTPVPINIKWEFTPVFRRNDPTIIMMAKILDWTPQQLDDVFNLAKTL